MSRRRARAHLRRLAFGLSLLLVAGTIATPAFASPPKTFDAAADASFEHCADVVGEDCATGSFTFTVTVTNTSRNTLLGSARVTLPDEVAEVSSATVTTVVGGVETNLGTVDFISGSFQPSNLGLSRRDVARIAFSGEASCDTADVRFPDPEAKQANNFDGEPGNTIDLKLSDASSLDVDLECPAAGSDDPLEDFDPGTETVDCGLSAVEDECSITVGAFTASATREAGASIGLRIVGAGSVGADIATAVLDACDTALDGLDRIARFGEGVIHLVPVGFSGDDDITVTSTIPRSFINTDVNRSPHIFEVCFAGEKADFGDPIAGADGLFGPIILEDCGGSVVAPCMLTREKVRADVVLTYQIPAEDPWMR